MFIAITLRTIDNLVVSSRIISNRQRPNLHFYYTTNIRFYHIFDGFYFLRGDLIKYFIMYWFKKPIA